MRFKKQFKVEKPEIGKVFQFSLREILFSSILITKEKERDFQFSLREIHDQVVDRRDGNDCSFNSLFVRFLEERGADLLPLVRPEDLSILSS